MIKVFGKPIRVNKASTDKTSKDVGANLFIGNLDPDVDEKVRGGGKVNGFVLQGARSGGNMMPLRHICYSPFLARPYSKLSTINPLAPQS